MPRFKIDQEVCCHLSTIYLGYLGCCAMWNAYFGQTLMCSGWNLSRATILLTNIWATSWKKVCDRSFPHSLKKFRVWEKSLKSDWFKLQNSINNKKGLFSYSKNVYKFQISKRALIWAKSKYWFLMPKIVFWRNTLLVYRASK